MIFLVLNFTYDACKYSYSSFQTKVNKVPPSEKKYNGRKQTAGKSSSYCRNMFLIERQVFKRQTTLKPLIAKALKVLLWISYSLLLIIGLQTKNLDNELYIVCSVIPTVHTFTQYKKITAFLGFFRGYNVSKQKGKELLEGTFLLQQCWGFDLSTCQSWASFSNDELSVADFH